MYASDYSSPRFVLVTLPAPGPFLVPGLPEHQGLLPVPGQLCHALSTRCCSNLSQHQGPPPAPDLPSHSHSPRPIRTSGPSPSPCPRTRASKLQGPPPAPSLSQYQVPSPATGRPHGRCAAHAPIARQLRVQLVKRPMEKTFSGEISGRQTTNHFTSQLHLLSF